MTLRPIQGAPPGAPNPEFPTTGRVAKRPGGRREGAGRKDHEPTAGVREMVEAMVAGGMFQDDIARAVGVSPMTLRKHYREELDAGKARIDAVAMVEHVKCMKRGDFQAIKWHHQAFMGVRGEAREDDAAANRSMRVTVEFVGESGPARPTIEHEPRAADDRDREAVRRNVQLIG